MIERLYIHNYKGFVNFELKCGQIVFLMGRNGSGKSSVLDLPRALATVIIEGDVDENLPSGTQFRYAEFALQEFELDVTLAQRLFRYRLELEPSANGDRSRVISEELTCEGSRLFQFAEGNVSLHADNGELRVKFPVKKVGLAEVESLPENRLLTEVKKWAEGFMLLNLDPWDVSGETGGDITLNVDGSNFASWLEPAAASDTEKLLQYIEEMRRVIPGFRSLKLEGSFQAHKGCRGRLPRQGRQTELSTGRTFTWRALPYCSLCHALFWNPSGKYAGARRTR